MAELDKTTLKSKIDTVIATNATGQITASVLNDLLKDMVDSLKDVKDYVETVPTIIDLNITVIGSMHGKTIPCANNLTVTVPDGLPEGFWCVFENEGTGTITFVKASGSFESDGYKLETRYTSALLRIKAANRAGLEGRLTN